MKVLKALLVGAVQGLTEFLPVSSSGHLALLAKLGVAPTSVFFNLALHLATLVALLLVMRKEVWEIVKHPIAGKGKYVVLASLPTALIAFLFKWFFPQLLLGSLLGFGFLLTSALLFAVQLFCRENKGKMPGAKLSLLTGVLQGIAVLPGVSRSGATIAALRLGGVEGEEAARFSFLLSIPVIVGGFLTEGAESGFSVVGANGWEICVAAIAAFVSGILAVKFMLKQIKKGLLPFVIYTFCLGVACIFLP